MPQGDEGTASRRARIHGSENALFDRLNVNVARRLHVLRAVERPVLLHVRPQCSAHHRKVTSRSGTPSFWATGWTPRRLQSAYHRPLDTDTGGATKKPFARAFYTEGKSLVYYAYDQSQRKADDAKFSYVAWGEHNGNKASINKIGLLFHDDQTQRRWSLNFADPEALAEIDSVFITLERTDEDVAQPKGKRMLTAYLGTPPNHP